MKPQLKSLFAVVAVLPEDAMRFFAHRELVSLEMKPTPDIGTRVAACLVVWASAESQIRPAVDAAVVREIGEVRADSIVHASLAKSAKAIAAAGLGPDELEDGVGVSELAFLVGDDPAEHQAALTAFVDALCD